MKSIKLSIVAALLATTSVVTSVSASEVEVSANMAITSNYMWRGMTQTADGAAIQGGVDLGYNGLYLGTWGSNVKGDTTTSEFDIYAGYAGEIGKISYDVGVIRYMYQHEGSLNFTETYASLGYDLGVAAVSGMYYVGQGDAKNGYEVGVSVPVSEVSLDATYGDYDGSGEYYSVGLTKSIGKFDVTVAYTGIAAEDAANDQDKAVVTVGTSF